MKRFCGYITHVSGLAKSKKGNGTSVIVSERAVSSCDWNFLEFGEAKLSSLDGIKTPLRSLGATKTQQERNKSETRCLIPTLLDQKFDI